MCLLVLRGPLPVCSWGSPFPGMGLERFVLNVNSNKCGYKTTGASATCHAYPKVHLNFILPALQGTLDVTSSSGSYSEFFQWLGCSQIGSGLVLWLLVLRSHFLECAWNMERCGLPSLKILLIPVWFMTFAGFCFSLRYTHKDRERQQFLKMWLKQWLKEKKILKAVTIVTCVWCTGTSCPARPGVTQVWLKLFSGSRDPVIQGFCKGPGTGIRSQPSSDSFSGAGTFPCILQSILST